mgnify:CR=1 FL=1
MQCPVPIPSPFLTAMTLNKAQITDKQLNVRNTRSAQRTVHEFVPHDPLSPLPQKHALPFTHFMAIPIGHHIERHNRSIAESKHHGAERLEIPQILQIPTQLHHETQSLAAILGALCAQNLSLDPKHRPLSLPPDGPQRG